MIREIVSDQFRLSQKSLPATKEDLPVVQDLLDTIIAHATGCVGMAANMIGINKNIIIVNDDGNYLVMLNPEIIKTMGRLYETEEGCLSSFWRIIIFKITIKYLYSKLQLYHSFYFFN